jgi:hypothetical protein
MRSRMSRKRSWSRAGTSASSSAVAEAAPSCLGPVCVSLVQFAPPRPSREMPRDGAAARPRRHRSGAKCVRPCACNMQLRRRFDPRSWHAGCSLDESRARRINRA